MTPDTLLALANLTVPRRPGRGPAIQPDPLAAEQEAAAVLGLPVVTQDLDALGELHAVVVALVDGLLCGRPVTEPAARLTELARPSVATARLDAAPTLRLRLDWSEPTPAAVLARRVALELGAVDIARLKRCARAPCDLVFYDTTRSGTRRWHAESPCGVRERQRRHRST